MIGGMRTGTDVMPQRLLESDPEADANYYGPQRKALELYEETRKKWKLDGFVYPALQIPTYDETAPGARRPGRTARPAGLTASGFPRSRCREGSMQTGFRSGLEISGVQWKDGDLMGYAYAYEQATHNRRLPKLVEGARK